MIREMESETSYETPDFLSVCSPPMFNCPTKDEYPGMKPTWVGSSLQDLRDFPEVPMKRAGFQLELLQEGEEPDDFKPMKSVGFGSG